MKKCTRCEGKGYLIQDGLYCYACAKFVCEEHRHSSSIGHYPMQLTCSNCKGTGLEWVARLVDLVKRLHR